MLRSVTVASAIAAIVPAALAADTLYSQPQSTGSAAISLTEGGNQFSFADRRRADNFTLPVAGDVEFVRFWGGTESDFFGSANLSNIEAFNIRIFSDAGGLPGTILLDETVPIAATNPTPTGQNVGLLNADMFRFEAALANPVFLDDGQQYWVSIAADVIQTVGLNAEGWQWAGSQVGDDQIASRSFDGNGYSLQPNFAVKNLAFEFEGTLIPAPGAAGLLGLAGLAAVRRRR
jgi:hypothetical protein